MKVLASKALLVSRLAFQAIAPKLLEYVVGIYQTESAGGDISRALVCLKSMRQLLGYGFKEVHVHEAYSQLVDLLAGNMKRALGIDGMQAYVLKTGKVFLELVEKRPLEFVLMSGWLNVARIYWGVIEGGGNAKVVVQGLVVLKNLIKHPGIR
jgi:hypothetical protein